MRDYGVVRVRFWSWAKRKKLSLEARDLALYLLTSPHGNSLGCFRLPMAYLCDDLDTNAKTANKSLEELQHVGFLERDEEDGWTWIRDYLEHNPIPNSNVGKSVGKLLEQVPPSVAFYSDLLEALTGFKVDADLIDTLSERYRNGFDTVVSVTETHTQTQEHDHTHNHTHEHEQPPAIENAVEAYNATAEQTGWAKVQRLTNTRRSALTHRLEECGGLEGWQCAMAKACSSKFLTGKLPRAPTHRNWRPDFDWFINATNFTKLMEGSYDDTTQQSDTDGTGILADAARAADILRGKQYHGI